MIGDLPLGQATVSPHETKIVVDPRNLRIDRFGLSQYISALSLRGQKTKHFPQAAIGGSKPEERTGNRKTMFCFRSEGIC